MSAPEPAGLQTPRLRRSVEAAEHLLAQAGEILGSSLDYGETIQRLAGLCTESLADYCVVHVEEGGRVRGLGLAHRDPARQEATRALLRRVPIEPGTAHPVLEVLRSGVAQVIPELDGAAWQRLARVPEQRAILREAGLCSLLVAPLRARGRTLGTLSLARTGEAPPYSEADLPLVEELAHRAAMAVDNGRLYREARRAVDLREQMLGVVSHDLRNSLNAALMNADLLLDIMPAFEPGTPGLRQMEGLRRSLDLMHRLVQDLLDVESIESGRLSLRPSRLPLRLLGGEIQETFSRLAQERGIELEVDVAAAGGAVLGDHDRLMQVFSNLVSNALGFTPAGGRVRVEAVDLRDRALFRVRDTGPGIPPEELPSIFERYWKSTLHRSAGSGLGLAIARGLVAAHGGELRVESTLGQGSTFSFPVPRPLDESPSAS